MPDDICERNGSLLASRRRRGSLVCGTIWWLYCWMQTKGRGETKKGLAEGI